MATDDYGADIDTLPNITAEGDRDAVYRVLDTDGSLLPEATEPDLTDGELVGLYADMTLWRQLDAKAVNWQRQGLLATYPPLEGQEAAMLASTASLDDDDWLFPTYRDHAAIYQHGMPLEKTLYTNVGHSPFTDMDDADAPNVFPISIPIASHLPHAVGAAMAADRKQDDAVTLVSFGDGATSEGDFHEAMNMAGVFDAPTVFYCHNNQYAISTPVEQQTASATIAQKADAYGFDGVRIDGMDPLAVYNATAAAVGTARNPAEDMARPTLIESVEYRFAPHSTNDDPSRYREDVEGEDWREYDALPRFEAYLRDADVLDDETIAAIEDAVDDRVARVKDTLENLEQPEPAELFDHTYAANPPRLQDQYDDVRDHHSGN